MFRNGLKPFAIDFEIMYNTNELLSGGNRNTRSLDHMIAVRVYGHEFEKAFTTSQISSSSGHNRIILYDFGDFRFIVRFETDAYVTSLPKHQPQKGGIGERRLTERDERSVSVATRKPVSRLPTNRK